MKHLIILCFLFGASIPLISFIPHQSVYADESCKLTTTNYPIGSKYQIFDSSEIYGNLLERSPKIDDIEEDLRRNFYETGTAQGIATLLIELKSILEALKKYSNSDSIENSNNLLYQAISTVNFLVFYVDVYLSKKVIIVNYSSDSSDRLGEEIGVLYPFFLDNKKLLNGISNYGIIVPFGDWIGYGVYPINSLDKWNELAEYIIPIGAWKGASINRNCQILIPGIKTIKDMLDLSGVN